MADVIKTVIIDDSLSCINALQNDLQQYSDILVLKSFTSAVEALSFVKKYRPHLLFLDMVMSEMSGLDFMQEISPFVSEKMCVIFYSGNNYEIEAIRNSAFDYLAKPSSTEKLNVIIERVREKLLSDEVNFQKEVEKFASKSEFVALQTDNGFLVVKPSRVVYFDYDEKRVWKVMLDDKAVHSLKYSTKPKDILKINPIFVQINQSQIINMDYLLSISTEGKKDFCLFYPPFVDLKFKITSKFFPALKGRIIFV